jgi:hypothetical protein
MTSPIWLDAAGRPRPTRACWTCGREVAPMRFRVADLRPHGWDTVRFYALRLHEAGMIKSTPQKILAQGTDWRFLNELKKELKG